MTVFNDAQRAETFRGREGIYDQVDYSGSLTDYIFTRNPDGTVSVSRDGFGTDTLVSIEGFWFGGEAAWYSLDDAVALTSGDTSGPESNLIGDAGDNILSGQAGVQDVFYAGAGDDRVFGGDGTYDQVDYDGELIEYTITQNGNGDIVMSHPTWGTDVLSDIDGFWFMREAAWYSVEDALAISAAEPEFRLDADDVLNGTPGNDVMRADASGTNFYGGTGNDTYRGRADQYDQVNFDGDIADYSFTQNQNGSVTISHEVWGTDTLFDIDGLWFNGPEGGWFSVEQAVDLFG